MAGGSGGPDVDVAVRGIERLHRQLGAAAQAFLTGWLARPFGWVLVAASAATAVLVAWFRIPSRADPGMDFRLMIWAPMRGLLSGYDVYNPGAVDYLLRYGVKRAETPHSPSLLVIFGWTAAFSEQVGWLVMVGLSGMALALCVLLLLPSASGRWVGLGVLLVVVSVVLSWPARTAYYLGQLTPITALGAVVAVRWRGPLAGAVAVLLMALSPQTAVPMTLLLFAAGRRRGLIVGWVVTLLLSLPVLLVASVNAGGGYALLRGASRAFRDLVNQNRIDLPFLFGLRGASAVLAGFLFLVVLAGLLHRFGGTRSLSWQRRSFLVFSAATPATVLSIYHQPYDIALIVLANVALLGVAIGMQRSFGAAALLAGTSVVLLMILLEGLYGGVFDRPVPVEIWMSIASPLVTVVGLLLAGASMVVMARASLPEEQG